MSHIYQKSATIYPGGEVWVPLNEAQVAEKAAGDRGFTEGFKFRRTFASACEGLNIDMARYKPIIPTMESCAAYADGQRDAAKQYVGKVDEAYTRGLQQGHNEATFQTKVRALRARDMLHMVMGLLRGDQPIAKGFLTSAIETLERM